MRLGTLWLEFVFGLEILFSGGNVRTYARNIRRRCSPRLRPGLSLRGERAKLTFFMPKVWRIYVSDCLVQAMCAESDLVFYNL